MVHAEEFYLGVIVRDKDVHLDRGWTGRDLRYDLLPRSVKILYRDH